MRRSRDGRWRDRAARRGAGRASTPSPGRPRQWGSSGVAAVAAEGWSGMIMGSAGRHAKLRFVSGSPLSGRQRGKGRLMTGSVENPGSPVGGWRKSDSRRAAKTLTCRVRLLPAATIRRRTLDRSPDRETRGRRRHQRPVAELFRVAGGKPGPGQCGNRRPSRRRTT